MSIKKSDVVEIRDTKKNIGFVLSGRDKFKVVFYDDVAGSYRVYPSLTESHLKVVDKSLMPEKLKERYEQEFNATDGQSLKKGQFVKFKDEKGVEQTGYVEKGGVTPTVIFNNGRLQIKAPSRIFSVTEPVFEKDEPSSMDNWSIVGYKEFKSLSDETVAYTAFIAYKGKKVLTAENTGKGGCDRIGCVKYSEESLKLEKIFYEDLKLWEKQFSTENHFEIDSLWIDWSVNDKKQGITAKRYFKNFEKEFKELTAG